MTDMQQAQATSRTYVDLDSIGYFLDGWLDLVEGMGEKAAIVQQEVYEKLQAKNMPDISIEPAQGGIGAFGSEKRDIILAETYPGVRTTISIRKHGDDLFVGWRTFITSIWNKGVFLFIFIIAGFLGFVLGGTQRSSWGETSFSITGFIGWSIGFALVGVILVGMAGRFLKGDILAFFFVQPNLFDADDVAALNLSVHKTLLRSLDCVGIDSSKLRIKQKFSGGRRGEDV